MDNTTQIVSQAEFYNSAKSIIISYEGNEIFFEDKAKATTGGIPFLVSSLSELADYVFTLKPGSEIHIKVKDPDIKELIPVSPPLLIAGAEKKIPLMSGNSGKVSADPVDRYVSLMEKQIDYLAQLQERNEARLDQRLQTILKALKPGQERQVQNQEINIPQLLEQFAPIIELLKKSGAVK